MVVKSFVTLTPDRAPVWMTLVSKIPPALFIRTDCGLRGCSSRLSSAGFCDARPSWQSLAGLESSGEDGLDGEDEEEHLEGVAPDLE